MFPPPPQPRESENRMSKQAQRYQPTTRQAVRTAITMRELAAEAQRYTRASAR